MDVWDNADRALPNPGERLIGRVAGGTDLNAFYASGKTSVEELRRALAVAGRSLESFSTALDFGCGCGRMLMWLEDLSGDIELHGTDIDSDAIQWCQGNLPYATFGQNHAEPPTRYPDGKFDLIFNHSVFTHIDERLQDLWLGELYRITRPGAMLVLSVHGERAIPQDAWEIRDGVETTGIFHLTESIPKRLGLPNWYQNTWHAAWYIFQHWQKWFRIRAYLPGGALDLQDQILLERLEGFPASPIGARSMPETSPAAAERVRSALASLERYQDSGISSGSAGLGRRVLRIALLKALRPYTYHQQKFNEAVVASVTELATQQQPRDE